jgi:hypothetical protein
MKSLLATLTLAITLITTSANAGIFDKKKNDPTAVDPDAVLTVADFVKTSGKGKLAGVTRVAIPNFFVQFVRDQTIERKGRLGSDSYTTQVRGIETATLQQIADALYDGFVAELQAAGVEVVPAETLEANADFSELRKVARVSPYTEESSMGGSKGDNNHQGVSVLVSAKNLPINIRNTIDDYWLKPNASDGFKVSLVTTPMKVSQALNVPLLDVRLTVAMATLKGRVSNSGSSYSVTPQTTSFSFDADLYPRFVDGGSLVALSSSEGGTIYSLTQPVIIKDLSFALEKGKGTGSRGAGLLGAISRAAGGSAEMDADAYIDLQAEDFSNKMTARGKEVAHLFVEAMIK